MAQTLGDSRVVEELHRFLRLLQKRGSNTKRSKLEKLLWTIASPVLPGRKCNHLNITKEQFLAQWSDPTLAKELKKGAFSPKAASLPASWSRILSPSRDWASFSTDAKRVEAAAWRAVQAHADMPAAISTLIPVQSARLSCLFSSQCLVTPTSGGDIFVTTTHDKFGVWSLPVELLSPGIYTVSPSARMLHSWGAEGWEAADFRIHTPAAMHAAGMPPYGGLCLERSTPWQPLAKHCFLHPPLRMTQAELLAVAEAFSLPVRKSWTERAIITAICRHLFVDTPEEELTEIIEAACKTPDSSYTRLSKLVDPLTEEVLDDLSDAEDAFPELTKIVRGRRTPRPPKPSDHKPKPPRKPRTKPHAQKTKRQPKKPKKRKGQASGAGEPPAKSSKPGAEVEGSPPPGGHPPPGGLPPPGVSQIRRIPQSRRLRPPPLSRGSP